MQFPCKTPFPSGPCVAIIDDEGLVVETITKISPKNQNFDTYLKEFEAKVLEAQSRGKVRSGHIKYVDGVCQFEPKKNHGNRNKKTQSEG